MSVLTIAIGLHVLKALYPIMCFFIFRRRHMHTSINLMKACFMNYIL